MGRVTRMNSSETPHLAEGAINDFGAQIRAHEQYAVVNSVEHSAEFLKDNVLLLSEIFFQSDIAGRSSHAIGAAGLISQSEPMLARPMPRSVRVAIAIFTCEALGIPKVGDHLPISQGRYRIRIKCLQACPRGPTLRVGITGTRRWHRQREPIILSSVAIKLMPDLLNVIAIASSNSVYTSAPPVQRNTARQ
jgi:hypothetical protein